MTYNNMEGLDEALLEVLTDAKFRPESWDNPPRLPMGTLAGDFATSGGWPRGRWSVIWGGESSGKSTTCLLSAAGVTQEGGNVAYIDVEHSFDEDWAAKLGVVPSRLFVTRQTSTEETLNKLRALIKLNAFDLIILDSIGAMASYKEIEGDIGDVTVAINARLLKDFFGRATPELEATKTAVALINQLRFKIGGNDPDPETMPGGQALKHASSLTIKMQKRYGKHVLMSGDEVTGNIFKGKVTKSKVGPPQRTFEITLRQDDYFGVDQIAEAAPLAVKLGILQDKNGGTYMGKGNAFFQGELVGNGVTQITAKFYENHTMFFAVEGRIRECLHKFQKPVAGDFIDSMLQSNSSRNIETIDNSINMIDFNDIPDLIEFE